MAGTPKGPLRESGKSPEAVKLLRSIRAKYGSEADLAGARDLDVVQEGFAGSREQTWNPAVEGAPAPRKYTSWLRSSISSARRDGALVYPGGVTFSGSASYGPTGGWSVDATRWRTGNDLTIFSPSDAVALEAQLERAFPHLALEQAARSDVLSSGTDWIRYRDASGKTIELVLSPISMLVMSSSVIEEGEPQPQLHYEEYYSFDGVMIPARTRLVVGPQMLEDLRIISVGRASKIGSLFNTPAGYVAPPPLSAPTLRPVAPGVYFFDKLPGNYHSMVVDQGSHLVLLEAPQSPAYAIAQRKLLDEALPGKPVRRVIITHHHSDHVAGLAPFVEAGAALVVPAGAEASIRRQFAAKGLNIEPKFERVFDRARFGEGASRVEAIAFSSSHTSSHLLIHIPDAQILFQGDLFYVPERGRVPVAFTVIEDLNREIERHGLTFSKIVGVHGRVASYDEFAEALRHYRSLKLKSGWQSQR